MKMIGYRRADFAAKDGTEIKGYNVYIATEIDPRNGAGVMAERQYLSDAKIARENLDLEKLLGREIKVYYNRFGKIDSIVQQD